MARILVIDDEDMVRLVLRQTLEKAGHEIVEATTGVEGIARQKEQPADLVITDIIMPDKEGVETIIELRQADPDLKIIAMSGGGRIGATDFLEVAKQYGATRTFSKPFDRKAMLEAVESCLKGETPHAA